MLEHHTLNSTLLLSHVSIFRICQTTGLSTILIRTYFSTRSIVHAIPPSYRLENVLTLISLTRLCSDFLVFFEHNTRQNIIKKTNEFFYLHGSRSETEPEMLKAKRVSNLYRTRKISESASSIFLKNRLHCRRRKQEHPLWLDYRYNILTRPQKTLTTAYVCFITKPFDVKKTRKMFTVESLG